MNNNQPQVPVRSCVIFARLVHQNKYHSSVMADCGTTGTALDQAARLFVGRSQNGANVGTNANPMLVANMLEQATMALLSHHISPAVKQQQPQQQSSIALTSTVPELEYLPQPQILQIHEAVKLQQKSSAPAATTSNNTAVTSQPPQHYHIPNVPDLNYSYLQQQQKQHYDNFLRHQQHQQQQQQSMIMVQQQQLQLHIRQQQISWMQQQQRHQQQQKQAIGNNSVRGSTNLAAEKGTITRGQEDIVQPVTIQKLSAAWADAIQHTVNEDDVHTTIHGNHEYRTNNLNATVQDNMIGANYDDLASAWAEAQVELQNEIDDVTNIWSGENTDVNQYQFQNATTHENHIDATSNWMEVGYHEFQVGNINTAIHAFEMELQTMDMDNATIWCMLGKCHAENDMDALAIQCFEEAVSRDPYSMESLLSLGVSYVNELNHVSALRNLKAWILHNTKFANLETSPETDIYAPSSTSNFTTTSTDDAFDEVQRLLLGALDFQMQQNRDDHTTTASVLEALGVVYNVSRDYDAAIDVLQQSCALRPQDYQLWNKLGATLANSGEHRSEEALSAYHQALHIKPKYARAWLNMAIAHSNLQQYHDAARCYLQTLSINPNAIHCWSYLRVALSCLEMDDLLPAASARNLDAFREQFDFVTYTDT
jgi:peroxin-5